MKCPRCQQENPSPGNFCPQCGGPLGVAVVHDPSHARRNENDELRRSLRGAIEQQTATAEILRVISNSSTDVQPVFDTIVRSGVRLCDGLFGFVGRFDGDLIHIAAHHNYTPDALSVMQEMYPMRPSRQQMSGRVILTSSVVQIEDLQEDPEYAQRLARAGGWRASLGVPLLREGSAIGMIAVMRGQPGPFSETQVRLLQTFADQAVIAIENVRLFKELEARNRDLTESLDRQTATSEILRVISSSPTDIQPVFDSIAQSAARLCDALDASIFRVDGDRLVFVAHHGPIAQRHGEFWLPLVRGTVGGRSVLESRTIQVADLQNEGGEFPDAVDNAQRFSFHTILSVPLIREGVAIGGIQLRRAEVQLFGEQQVALLQTFADQAVLAIENVRLFNETKDALERQTATSEILNVINQSPTDVLPVFDTIVKSAMRLCNAVQSNLQLFDGELMHWGAQQGIGREAMDSIRRIYPMRPDQSMTASRSVLTRSVVHVPDVLDDPEYLRELALKGGFRSVLSVPMMGKGRPIGAITVGRMEAGLFSETEITLLQTFADQAVIAIENVRLFKELEVANRELSAASQHKSEFLANMSHELRTPLNAIIGFSEVLAEKMFGELNEKQEEYSKDIHASGQHLLSLINDILDLSKIEAGRMELELSEFHLPTALDSALTLVRERSGRRGIALNLSVDERLGQMRADERKVRQVVLNLLSNAIKFTPEGGRVEVAAVPKDGFVEVSVSDTGVGIAPEDQEAVFEEFRQVGTADKKVEGTGLGLTLCRKFVELHGGRIWVKSQVGDGSTFTFTIPAHPAG